MYLKMLTRWLICIKKWSDCLHDIYYIFREHCAVVKAVFFYYASMFCLFKVD